MSGCDGLVLGDHWVAVCRVGDIPPDGARRFQAGGARIALFHVDGRYLATADRCPHGEASLADGWIEDGVVECPLHQARFAIATGKLLCGPARHDVATYAVEIKDGTVFVRAGPP